MALGERPHHRRLAPGPEGGAGFRRLLDRDQAVDDLAALHQQAMHRLVDAVDLLPQLGERGSGGRSVILRYLPFGPPFAVPDVPAKPPRYRHPRAWPADPRLGRARGVDGRAKPGQDGGGCARVDATGCGDYRYVRKIERVSSYRMSHIPSLVVEPHNQVDEPSSPVGRFGADEPLMMDAGVALAPWQIAYQTYGTLNAHKSNAVLVCHALTGDQHVANVHPVTGKPGWWETMVGPGRPLDTDRFFVICPNVIGGCMGTTGPASQNPATGRPYALDFPGRHDPRHGARAGRAHRPPRHREPVLRCRRLDGRHAGAAMGGELSRAGLRRPADRRRRRATRPRTSPSTRSGGRP